MLLIIDSIFQPGKGGVMADGFKCPYCETVAKSKQGFEKHAKSAHPEETYFICADCNIVAKSEQGLKKHRASAH